MCRDELPQEGQQILRKRGGGTVTSDVVDVVLSSRVRCVLQPSKASANALVTVRDTTMAASVGRKESWAS